MKARLRSYQGIQCISAVVVKWPGSEAGKARLRSCDGQAQKLPVNDETLETSCI
jgi:hypothetical protein